MKLEDFISNTLIEIINGVATAQNYAKEHGAKINPSNISIYGASNQGSPLYWDNYNSIAGQTIEFDVSVTTHEEGQKEGKAGVYVPFIKAGVSGKEVSQNSATNRIKFNVPVFLPIQQKVNE